MRIAIIGARGIPARWGGFETVASELAPRLVRRGHTVSAYVRGRYSLPSRPATYEGVQLIYLPALYTKSLETASHEVLSAAHAFAAEYDVIYVLGFRTSFLYPLARLFGRRIVMNTDGFDWQRRKWGRLARLYLRAAEYIGACWAASHLICDSRSLQPYFESTYGRTTTYIGYGANVFDSVDASVLSQYGLTPREYLLVVARIEPENNTDLIIRAFERVRTSKQLVIVGTTNYRSPYVQRLRDTQDERVRFLGGVYEPGHIEALYAHSYAYIHGHEVGGTNPALLHAMGCGCCILALDVPFNREVLSSDGVLWAKSDDALSSALERILAEPARADALRDAAQNRARAEYSWEGVADAYDQFFRSQVATAPPRRWQWVYASVKRMLDIVAATVLLVALSPVLLLIAAAVRFSSGSPVLYRWHVAGQAGRPFTSYKFRTMVPNADTLKADLLDANEMTGPVFKLRRDPRVTAVGRFLRKYSLDELPQLWSVLVGDMSLVGPRPPLQTEYARFTEWQRRKLDVKPGITCLWQISGRNEIRDFDEWVRLDLEYIEKQSLWLDCQILLKTLPAVLRARGAV